MPVLRILLERSLLLLFSLARVALLTQGLSMLAAVLAASALVPAESPPWLQHAMWSSRLVSASLLVAGVVLMACRRLGLPRTANAGRSDWFWPALLALSLASLAALAWARASDLLSLWQQISRSLEEIGFWEAAGKSDPFGGIVLLPIMAALLVPALETAAAFALIALPPAMVVLLATRSRLFPRIFAMMVVCQLGFVIAGILAADAFSTLSTEFLAAMATQPDAEMERVGSLLTHGRDVLVSTSMAFVAPALGSLAWLPFLLRSALFGAFFSAGAEADPPRALSGTNQFRQGGSGRRGPLAR